MSQHRKSPKSPKSPKSKRNKARMADSRTTENCLRWITDEEHIHRTAEYGDNLRSVGDALSEQVSRDQLVQDYSKEVKAVSRDKEDDVNVRYECLKTVSSKRLSCLEDINQIAGLEELLGALSVSFADKASQLVAAECQREVHVPEKDGAGVKAAAQNCILAVRSNWAWLSKLVKCTDIHLQHSSDYHEFFHEVHEYEHWMPIELRDCKDKVKFTEETEGDRAEANRMLLDLKDLLIMFIHWQGKLEKLYNRSKNVIPVHLRTQKLDYFRPVSSLCDYKTKEIHMREGEELLLIDNSKAQSWTVRNMNAVESQVPAVVCLLSGPDPDAMQAAMRLRFQLLVEWTQNVKRIGKALIFFMILVLRDWSDDEIKMLKAIPSRQKDDIRRCLDYVESVLAPYWAEYEGYQEYKRRADDLREILAQDGDPADRDSEKTAELLQKLFVVEDLLKNYNTYWKHWETFKMLVETCKHDDYMLICEKWQELQFIGLDELRRMWHDRLKFSDEDNIDFATWLKRQKELWYSLQGRGMTSDRGTLKRMVTVEEESIVPQKGHVLGEGKEDQSRNRQATTMQAMLGLSAQNGSTNQNNYDAMHIEKEEVVETEEVTKNRKTNAMDEASLMNREGVLKISTVKTDMINSDRKVTVTEEIKTTTMQRQNEMIQSGASHQADISSSGQIITTEETSHTQKFMDIKENQSMEEGRMKVVTTSMTSEEMLMNQQQSSGSAVMYSSSSTYTTGGQISSETTLKTDTFKTGESLREGLTKSESWHLEGKDGVSSSQGIGHMQEGGSIKTSKGGEATRQVDQYEKSESTNTIQTLGEVVTGTDKSSATTAMYGTGSKGETINTGTVQERESVESITTLGKELTVTEESESTNTIQTLGEEVTGTEKSSATTAMYGTGSKGETIYTETVQERESVESITTLGKELTVTEESSVSAATYGSGPGIEEDIMCAETAQESESMQTIATQGEEFTEESSATAAMYGAGINEDIITAETVQESESMQSVATLGSEVTETKSSANAALYGSETKEETMYTETVQESESMQTQSEELTQTEETSTNYQTTTSESVTSVEQEERKTFVITGVIDTRTDEEVSMQKAVMLGIINSSQGIYVNLKNGESYPIPVAMNAGLIKVEFTSTKKSEEKRRDVGLITIKTQRESRPYSVKAVVDAVTDEHLTVDKAIQKGILDQRKGIYKNARDKIDMSLADALDSGLLIVEFDKNAEVTEPEIVTKTYAIHGVVDQKKKAKVTFTEAVKQNLLDRETGAYRNNITNQMMYVGDAIMKGFIKATLVKDPNSLDIDPENRMVVQKLQSVRKQLLNPLTATAALKRAADHYEQNGK